MFGQVGRLWLTRNARPSRYCRRYRGIFERGHRLIVITAPLPARTVHFPRTPVSALIRAVIAGWRRSLSRQRPAAWPDAADRDASLALIWAYGTGGFSMSMATSRWQRGAGG